MDKPLYSTNLPAPIVHRETIRYVARPGLAALPSGTFVTLAFLSPQVFSAYLILWVVWWPFPETLANWVFAVGMTLAFAGAAFGILFLLMRRNPGFLLGIARAPFIRLVVTDRRVMWRLPWHAAPLLEIGCERVLGGIIGPVDRRGRGSVAMVLVPGDPMGDIDGNVHFDRLPDAAGFIRALAAD